MMLDSQSYVVLKLCGLLVIHDIHLQRVLWAMEPPIQDSVKHGGTISGQTRWDGQWPDSV